MEINTDFPRKYTIDDLSELTGFSRRTIRFYIQENIIEAPAGRGRGGFYFDSHLSGLLKIRELQKKGLNLESIRNIINKRTGAPERVFNNFISERMPDRSNTVDETTLRQAWARYELSDGIELSVRKDIEARDARKIREIIKVLNLILKETDDD